MDRALLPAVRVSRLSRSLWLVPTLLLMVLSCSLVGYAAGYFDGKEAPRPPLAPATIAKPSEPVSIVNVAAGVTDISPLLGLRLGEGVVSINGITFDTRVDRNTKWIFDRRFHDRKLHTGYWDVETEQRRILVLFH